MQSSLDQTEEGIQLGIVTRCCPQYTEHALKVCTCVAKKAVASKRGW